MITEIVFSPYEDKKISNNILGSIIWRKCFKPDEITDEIKKEFKYMHKYIIKFDGLTPIQVNKHSLVNF